MYCFKEFSYNSSSFFILLTIQYIVLSDRKFVGSIPWEYKNELVG